jgi:hypothetical protein
MVPFPVASAVKQPAREADHSPKIRCPEVKNSWSYTSTPYAFMPQCLHEEKNRYLSIVFVYLTIEFIIKQPTVQSSEINAKEDFKIQLS